MSDIFISYASADRERAKLLSKALQRRGWSVWWDRTIPPGKEYDQVIEEALDSAQSVVVLWSQASVASTWVKTEAAEAMRRKILVPALIEDVKIPLEFRRLQAADLSHWRGEPEHPELEEFFQSIDRNLQGHGLTAVITTPPPVQSEDQPRRRNVTPPVWRAVAMFAPVVIVALGLLLWRFQQDESAPPVPAQEVSAPAQEVSPASAVTPVPTAVDQPGPVRQLSADGRQPAAPADARATQPPVSTSPRPPAREPERVADASSAAKTSKPASGAPADVKPSAPAAVHDPPATSPVEASPEPATTPTRPARSADLPVASPRQYEEVIWVTTKDGETEELETFLLLNDTSLVLKDEDSNILRTLPYSNIQKATYSRTQRRIMLVRTTRHWLTLGVGKEEIVLRLPDASHLSILSQIEQRAGVTIVRHVE